MWKKPGSPFLWEQREDYILLGPPPGVRGVMKEKKPASFQGCSASSYLGGLLYSERWCLGLWVTKIGNRAPAKPTWTWNVSKKYIFVVLIHQALMAGYYCGIIKHILRDKMGPGRICHKLNYLKLTKNSKLNYFIKLKMFPIYLLKSGFLSWGLY